jgi:hypothetical protein
VKASPSCRKRQNLDKRRPPPGGGVVLAMATTGEVDGGTPVDKGEAWDGGMARQGEGCAVRGGRACGG